MTDPAPAAAPAPVVAAPAPAPWYGDKIDEVTRGFWSNKGIDPSDPVMVATKLTDFYRQAEQRIGAPPEELIRIPKPNAPESDVKAYWGRIGVPAEAKDYDLSTVKFSDGSEMTTAFADTLRSAMYDGRVPKDRAPEIAKRLLKHMEDNDAAEAAERTSHINAEREALAKNWGQQASYNAEIAKRALDDFGKLAGLTPDQTRDAWDALSKIGGIGASHAMEILRLIGSRMGTRTEPNFIGGQPGQGGDKVMSASEAKARIDDIKSGRDKAMGKRIVDGDQAAKREWDDLHKIAFPSRRVA